MSDPNQESESPTLPLPPPKAELTAKGERPLKLRVPAIALFVIGLLLAVGGIAKFIPGGVGTGGALCFFGILLFVFSFIRLPEVTGDEAPMSVGQKLAGIFFEPTRVFRNLRFHPRWLAPFLIISFLSAAYTAAFMQRLTPERIVNFTMDKVVESGFAPAETLERSRAEQIEQGKNPVQRAGKFVQAFVGVFVLTSFVAALYLVGVLIFGGRMNFWQSLAATFYASLPIVIIQKIVSLVILYIKSPEDIHPILGQETLLQDNLGVLFTPAEHPVLFVAASVIGVLSFYGLWLRAKGLQNGGTKVSSTAAWSSVITVWLLAVIFGLALATFFPSFIS
jgi:hypothetical protein